jgi:hypothetical protein
MSEDNLARLRGSEEDVVRKREEFFRKLNTDKNFPEMVRRGMARGLMINTFVKRETAPVGYKYRVEFYLGCEDIVKGFQSIAVSVQ